MRKIIISAFLVVLGMHIEMYGERRWRDLQVRRPNVQYMAGLERAQGIGWCLNYIHSMGIWKLLTQVLRPTQLK